MHKDTTIALAFQGFRFLNVIFFSKARKYMQGLVLLFTAFS